ncbi:uncharacterized protein LOC143292696 isoform X2 [Babylonia areolata]|uniref:uncharacterized protein LOC143292696 isoform X2 n=1 Tax=Babylonia areolata TaxID=304850 RepID=UPI003FD5C6E5
MCVLRYSMARKRVKVFVYFCFLIVMPVFSVDVHHQRRLRRGTTWDQRSSQISNADNHMEHHTSARQREHHSSGSTVVADPRSVADGHYHGSHSESISNSVVEHHNEQPLNHHESGVTGSLENGGGRGGGEGRTGYFRSSSSSVTGTGQSQPGRHYHSSVRSWSEHDGQQPTEHHHNSVTSWSENHHNHQPVEHNHHSGFSESSSSSSSMSTGYHHDHPVSSFHSRSSSFPRENSVSVSNDQNKDITTLPRTNNIQSDGHHQTSSSDSRISAVHDQRHGQLSQRHQSNAGGGYKGGYGHPAANFQSRQSSSSSSAVFETHNGRPTHNTHTHSNVVVKDDNTVPQRTHHTSSGSWLRRESGPLLHNNVVDQGGHTDYPTGSHSHFHSSHAMFGTDSNQPTQSLSQDSGAGSGSSGHHSSHFQQIRTQSSSMMESRNGQPTHVSHRMFNDMLEDRDGSLPRHLQQFSSAEFESPKGWHSSNHQKNTDDMFKHQSDHMSHLFANGPDAVSDNGRFPFHSRSSPGFRDWDDPAQGHVVRNGLDVHGSGGHHRYPQSQELLGSGFGNSDDVFGNMLHMHDDFFGPRHRPDLSGFPQRLNVAEQTTLLNRMMEKPFENWTRRDLRQAIRMTPDVFGNDFWEGLPRMILRENLDLFGSVSSLSADFMKAIGGSNFDIFNASAITNMGKGLLYLRPKHLMTFKPSALLTANISDIFKDSDAGDDPLTKKMKESERGGQRLAIGLRMKQAGPLDAPKLGKVTRFLYDNLNFLSSVKPEDLYAAAPYFTDLNLDMSDAFSLYKKMSQSSDFPKPDQFSHDNLLKLRGVLPGMGLSRLKQVPDEVISASVSDLNNVTFGESEARVLMKDFLGKTTSSVKASGFTVENFKTMGTLARGLTVEDIKQLKDSVVLEAVDVLGKVDFSDAQKKLLAPKTLAVNKEQGALKLLQLPKFADTLSLVDIENISNKTVSTSLTSVSTVPLRPAQAAALVNKLKKTVKNRGLGLADLPRMGKLVRGLLPTDLNDMADKLKDPQKIELIGALGKQERVLSSAQIDNVLEQIDSLVNIKGNTHVTVDYDMAGKSAPFLMYLPKDQWNNVSLDWTGVRIVLSFMSKMDTKKIPRGLITNLVNRFLPNMTYTPGVPVSDYDKIKQLGQFALGLTKEQIENMDANAVVGNLPLLGTLPFTREQAKAILGRVKKAESEWKCKETVLAGVGPLLQFAEKEEVESLCIPALAGAGAILEKGIETHLEHVRERREEGLWREDSADAPDSADAIISPTEFQDSDKATEDKEGQKRLAQRLLTAVLNTAALKMTAGRVRRASGEPKLTCGTLRLMRADIVNVDVNRIVGMADSEFQDCLDALGSAKGWGQEELGTVFQHFKKVYGLPSTWTNEIIRQAGVLISRLPASQFSQLNLRAVDALNSISRNGYLYSSQLQAGFSRWLDLAKNGSIESITPGEFSAMSDFVCGLTVEQISRLPEDVIRHSVDVVGRAKHCREDQEAAYLDRTTKVYHKTPAPVVGEMGRLIGAMDSKKISELDADQIALIRPSVFATLPTSFAKSMTIKQLSQLSTNQVNAFRNEQFQTLNDSQKAAVAPKITVPRAALSDDGSDAGVAIRWSLTSVMAAVFVSFTFC